MLGGHGQLRDRSAFSGFVRSARLHPDGASANLSAAMVNQGNNFFIFKEFIELPLHAGPALKFADALVVSLARYLVLIDLGQGFLCIPFR